MTAVIRMPRLGAAMREGTLAGWLVAEGAAVAAGQPLYRVETDKVDDEIGAPVAGTVHLVAEAGGTYPVGATLAEIE